MNIKEERKKAVEWLIKKIKNAPRWFIPKSDIERWYDELDLEPLSNMFQQPNDGGIKNKTEDDETGEVGYYSKDVIDWLKKNENIGD